MLSSSQTHNYRFSKPRIIKLNCKRMVNYFMEIINTKNCDRYLTVILNDKPFYQHMHVDVY